MRRAKKLCSNIYYYISIHAPLTGCDVVYVGCYKVTYKISIHAPLTGCDHRNHLFWKCHSYFNPRTPYGMRLRITWAFNNLDIISIHAPLTGCDSTEKIKHESYAISIHAPLTGCDRHKNYSNHGKMDFNPRTPYGMRPVQLFLKFHQFHISIHAPLTGCDGYTKPSQDL